MALENGGPSKEPCKLALPVRNCPTHGRHRSVVHCQIDRSGSGAFFFKCCRCYAVNYHLLVVQCQCLGRNGKCAYAFVCTVLRERERNQMLKTFITRQPALTLSGLFGHNHMCRCPAGVKNTFQILSKHEERMFPVFYHVLSRVDCGNHFDRMEARRWLTMGFERGQVCWKGV